MKKNLYFIPLLLTSLLFTSCTNQNSGRKSPILSDCTIHRDAEFGGAYIDISIPDFNKKGFTYGDSLNLSFSNNVIYNDIGYYSGYYVPAGQELVVAYPGYDYIKFCINYGDDVYTMNNFDNNTRVTITLNQQGKYKDIEETLSISYSDNVEDYPEGTTQFANFREMNVGNLKPNTLYRGASPIDNRRKRAAVVDSLLEQNNIQFDIDLADKSSTGNNFVIGNYFKGLKENNKVVFLGMAAAYKTDEFAGKMKQLFEAILNNDGPYYIHCLEGKDRTGYVCMVIEALCGATYDELVDDYFVTYHNYYGIEKGSNKYDVIKSLHIDEMIRYVFGFQKTTNLLLANYCSQVNDYLLSIGLTQEQINDVQTKLSRQN